MRSTCPQATRWRGRAVVVAVASSVAALAAYPALLPSGAAASPARAPVPVAWPRADIPSAAVARATTRHFRLLPLRGAKQPPAAQPKSQPLSVRPGAIDGASTSDNWSGYVDSGPGSQFSEVSGSWSVPSITGSVVGAASSWVGIGGWSTPGLVQTGIEVRNTLGYKEYFAWYEILPQQPIVLGNVAPGDRMHADIVQDGPSTWTITLTDLTERTTWSGPVAATVNGTTAEWVEEAPISASTESELALIDFRSVRFSQLAAEGPGVATATAQPFYMVSSKAVLAYPSRYDAATNSFTVSYGPPANGVTGFPPVPIGTPAPTPSTTTTTTSTSPSGPSTSTSPPPPPGGYWLVGADGGVFAFGGARFYGSATTIPGPSAPITGIAATPDHKGYWLVSSDGAVLSFGDARSFGSIPGLRASGALRHALGQPIVGIAATKDGRGYYLVSQQGGVYTFGDARFEGSCGSLSGACSASAAALVPDSTGAGYWLVLGDATSQAFGDAPPLRDADCLGNALYEETTAVAAVPSPDGRGYWTLLAAGTTCASGDAVGRGIWAAYGTAPVSPAVAMVTTDDGAGAWVVLSNGAVGPYGTALSLGDLSGRDLAASIVAAAGW